ncbi:MAG: hypothetical protein RIT27_832 [Pseudomonadota bacterium]|jgi:hypothetical protein
MNNLPHDKQIVIEKEGDYFPANSSDKNPPTNKPKRKWFPLVLGLSFLIILFFGLQLGRQWYDSLMARLDHLQKVHPDESKIVNPIKPQIKPQVQLSSRFQNGQTYRVLVDAEKYSNFVQQQIAFFEEQRQQLQIKTQQKLKADLAPIFQQMQQRIPLFADWYFAYLTTYDLLLKATSSVVQHSLSSEAQNLSGAISYDLQRYFQQHYEQIILQPEINDPLLQTLYQTQLKTAYLQWLESLAMVQDKFQLFVSQQTTHLQDVSQKVSLELDWKSHLNKINFANYQKSGAETWRGLLFATGGGVTGKAVGSALAKGIAAKTAETTLFSKLASPFAAKALTIGGSGAIGSLGGPIGALAGVLGGIGIDYLLNEGIGLMQRDAFIHDTDIALQSTKATWAQILNDSLNQTIQIWFDDSIQLLPKYEMMP